ncbi:MAG: class I SAM-dependent methyltransferase [Eubacteriales bacterium]|nr:class I SAM-dependent methyltransferase [Eubacteriales bacterium]
MSNHHSDIHNHPHHHAHTPSKLDNPVRAAELNPETTLRRIGYTAGQVLCDIGAGSGLFTLPAAHIAAKTNTPVIALDINNDMLEAIRQRATDQGLTNVDLRLVTDTHLPVDSTSADHALLVTVLHEIIDYPLFLQEIHRLLKSTGRLTVIEFHHLETPYGPSIDHRLASETVIARCLTEGFLVADEFNLGPNFYTVVFVKK